MGRAGQSTFVGPGLKNLSSLQMLQFPSSRSPITLAIGLGIALALFSLLFNLGRGPRDGDEGPGVQEQNEFSSATRQAPVLQSWDTFIRDTVTQIPILSQKKDTKVAMRDVSEFSSVMSMALSALSLELYRDRGFYIRDSRILIRRLDVAREKLRKGWKWPCQHGKQNRAAICAVARWEGLHLQEWLVWHLLLGFERIYIYGDRISEDQTEHVAAPFVDAGFLVLEQSDNNGTGQQPVLYNKCLDRIRSEKPDVRWVAVMDLDEYLFFRPKAADAPKTEPVADALPQYCFADFLHRYQDRGAVIVNWLVYSPSFVLEPKELLVPEMLTRCRGHLEEVIKSIYNLPHTIRTVDVHSGKFKPGHDPSDEDGSPQPASPSNSALFNRSLDALQLRLHHYRPRSLDHALRWLIRGRADLPIGHFEHTRVVEYVLNELRTPWSLQDSSTRHMAALMREVLGLPRREWIAV